MRIVRGLLLAPALKLLNWLLKHDGNSVIIGGPLGWTWEDTIDDDHHGGRGSGLHADSHARQHDHSLAADGSPIALDGVPDLPASQITSGRFDMPRMPAGILGLVITGQGVGADPVYAVPPSGAAIVPATLVVAASDSVDPTRADYQCDGIDDHVEIQAALDALPAGGGEVFLLEGTYNIKASVTMDSYQTLRGCGTNTVLVTSTDGLVFISATGAPGSEKVGITISDLQIDGGVARVSDAGIKFEYVDHSSIHRVYSRRHAYGDGELGTYESGIVLLYSDFNDVSHNICEGNAWNGIRLDHSNNNRISDNDCSRNVIYSSGIALLNSNDNIITGNVCTDNVDGDGITVIQADRNTISNNTVSRNTMWGIFLVTAHKNTFIGNAAYGNGQEGIRLHGADHNTVVGNTCMANSQGADNTFDDIRIQGSYNNIQGNTCRAGSLANKPRYGINISNVFCDENLVINNDLYDDGFGTAPFNDAGTGTKYSTGQLDNTPGGTDGETSKAPTSNVLYDHGVAITGCHSLDKSARAKWTGANQSIPHNTWTTLDFNDEVWDTDDIWASGANSSKLICKTAGIYIIAAGGYFAFNTTGTRECAISVNGSAIALLAPATNQAGPHHFALTTIYSLAVNDYVQFRVKQTSGGALDLVTEAPMSPALSMARIA